MIDTEINKRYCQSCGMPLRFDVEEYLGTNTDGSRSDEFCFYCLKDGHYTVDVSMPEMVDIWVKYAKEYNGYSGTSYTPQTLRTVLNKRLPTLNRWRQKQETQNIHEQTIQKITAYIGNHLFENLDMDTLISMSALSKFHFRRVFQAVTGENVATFIQRLRLEQIAHLLISTDYTLEQIVKQTNYQTKSSLAKAFQKHFGVSTSAYKKKYRQTVTGKPIHLEPEIRFVTGLYMLCLEVSDAYRSRDNYKYRFKWDRLSRYIKQNKLNGSQTKFASISPDDPLITPVEKCRFYIGMAVPKGTKPEAKFSVLPIPQGRYAVFKHTGNYVSLHKLYKAIYEEWLPQSKYRPNGTLTFEMYLNSPRRTKVADLMTEVYIPIEKKA